MADAVVLFMGLDPSMEGEEGDAFNGANAGDKADLQLPDSQKRLWKGGPRRRQAGDLRQRLRFGRRPP